MDRLRGLWERLVLDPLDSLRERPFIDRLRNLWQGPADRLGSWWERSPRTVVATIVAALAVPALAVTAILLVNPAAEEGLPAASQSTALEFAVLAGTTITNTGPSVISGEMGVSPGTAISGFPPGEVNNGATHVADAVAAQAQSDLESAYNDAVGQVRPTAVPADLGGMTLVPGLYKQATSLGLTGTLTLDAEDDPAAVFIFQAGFTLSTAPDSAIELVNGAQACNVFWQVGSSATLGTGSTFVGSILALASVTVQTGTDVSGRVLARIGQISLDASTITRPTCDDAADTGPFAKTNPPSGDPPEDASTTDSTGEPSTGGSSSSNPPTRGPSTPGPGTTGTSTADPPPPTTNPPPPTTEPPPPTTESPPTTTEPPPTTTEPPPTTTVAQPPTTTEAQPPTTDPPPPPPSPGPI